LGEARESARIHSFETKSGLAIGKECVVSKCDLGGREKQVIEERESVDGII
jgi:hypothetical protein